VRRRLTALLVLVVLAAPAIALASSTDPVRRLDPADGRKADSIIFKQKDFAVDWKRVASSVSGGGGDLSCAYYKPDGSDLTLTGHAEAEFARGGVSSVLSYADVYATAKDAATAWSRTVRPALARCLGDFFEREAAAPGMKVSVVGNGRAPFPRVAPRTAAFRIDVKMLVTQSGQTKEVPLALPLLVIGRGRAEAGFLTFASRGVSTGDLHTYGKLLAERMKAAGF
jgi:hypothetical protein